MAISGFGNKVKVGEREVVGGSAPAASATNLSAFIDQGSEFEGKLNFKDTVRIDGLFRGEITSENTLLVGESGQIEALIHSQAVVICGQVTGNVIAGRQVVLHKGARVDGDVTTPSIVIEEGAILNGRISMEPETATTGLAEVKVIRDAKKPGESGGADTRPRGVDDPSHKR